MEDKKLAWLSNSYGAGASNFGENLETCAGEKTQYTYAISTVSTSIRVDGTHTTHVIRSLLCYHQQTAKAYPNCIAEATSGFQLNGQYYLPYEFDVCDA